MEFKDELRIELEKLENLERIANEKEIEYDENPESEEAEQAFDSAYSAEWWQADKVAKMIHKSTGIQERTARRMLREKREKLKELLK